MRARTVKRWWWGLAVSMCLAAGVASAAVPPTLTHQGRLFADDGTPVSDTFVVTFSIYEKANDVTPCGPRRPRSPSRTAISRSPSATRALCSASSTAPRGTSASPSETTPR